MSNYERAAPSSHGSSTTKKIANAIADLVIRRSSPSIRRKTEADVHNSNRNRKVSAPANLQHALVPVIDVVVATGALASSSVDNLSASTSSGRILLLFISLSDHSSKIVETNKTHMSHNFLS